MEKRTLEGLMFKGRLKELAGDGDGDGYGSGSGYGYGYGDGDWAKAGAEVIEHV